MKAFEKFFMIKDMKDKNVDIDPNIRAERHISSHRPWPIGQLLVKTRKFLHEEIMRAIEPILQKQIIFNRQIQELIQEKEEKERKGKIGKIEEEWPGRMAIIILNFNTWQECTKKCIELAIKNTIDARFILVENGSSKKEKKLIRRYAKNKNILLVDNKKNMGFAAGINQALSLLDQKDELVCFLNSDCFVEEEGWDDVARAAFAYEKNLGAIELSDQCPIFFVGQSKQSKSFPIYYARELQGYFDSETLTGACLVINRKRIGNFRLDENFGPAYYEDTDLSFEIRKRGFALKGLSGLKIKHHGGKTFEKLKKIKFGGKNYTRDECEKINRKKFLSKWDWMMKDFTTINEHLEFIRTFYKTFYKSEIKFGLNVLADTSKDIGISRAAKNMIETFKIMKIPISENIETNIETPSSIFPINYIHANADTVRDILLKNPKKYFQNKYNIGLWTWELSNFPEKWKDAFRYFDEIWVPSSFVKEAVSKISPIPIIKINHPILIEEIKKAKRHAKIHAKKNEKVFVFLFAFDYIGYFERKNPLAVVEAFRRAFEKEKNVRLIIKTSHSELDKENAKKLKKAARGLPIIIIDKELPRHEFLSLLNSCDCFVSLHRSEGFGLIIAEAMAAGKPVIVTAYSGNMDFTNSKNSFLVNYDLKKIKKDVGVYEKGNFWAEPDVGQAAKLMRYVFENREEAAKIGKKASLYIKKELSTEKIGKQIKKRLDLIYKNLKK